DIEKYPYLQPAVVNLDRPKDEKALFFVHKHFPKKVVSSFPARAILLPRVTGLRKTEITPASSKQALMALAPSTIFQLSGAGHSAFFAISKFVKKVRCFNLELGTEASGITDAIRRLLSWS